MVKHIVLLQYKSNITEEEINLVYQQLASLPTVRHFTSGANCSIEQLNKGFTHGFIIEFDDIEGRNAYLNHPEHQRIALEVLLPLLENGFESALVLDFEC